MSDELTQHIGRLIDRFGSEHSVFGFAVVDALIELRATATAVIHDAAQAERKRWAEVIESAAVEGVDLSLTDVARMIENNRPDLGKP